MRFKGEIGFEAESLVDLRNYGNHLIRRGSILDMWEGYSILGQVKNYEKQIDIEDDLHCWIITTKKWFFYGFINYECKRVFKSKYPCNSEYSYNVIEEFNRERGL